MDSVLGGTARGFTNWIKSHSMSSLEKTLLNSIFSVHFQLFGP